MGSDTQRNKVLQVSDPAELSPGGMSLRRLQVLYIAGICSSESDTPHNNILRGLIPDIRPLGTTSKVKYIREFETEPKNILGCESGAHMGSIKGKTEIKILLILPV